MEDRAVRNKRKHAPSTTQQDIDENSKDRCFLSSNSVPAPTKRPKKQKKIKRREGSSSTTNSSLFDYNNEIPWNISIESSTTSTIAGDASSLFVWNNNNNNDDKDDHRRLSDQECHMWSSSLAAKYASLHYAPAQFYRRLGWITRSLVLVDHTNDNHDNDTNKENNNNNNNTRPRPTKVYKKRHNRVPSPPTLAQCRRNLPRQQQVADDQQQQQQQQLQLDWKEILRRGTITPGWGKVTGEVCANHPNAVSFGHLLSLLSKNNNPQGKHDDDDDDDDDDNDDLHSLIEALMTLMEPSQALYQLPLLTAYPLLVLQPDSQQQQQQQANYTTTTTTYRLIIPVFASRLLFECMTQTLQTVMSALDPNSYSLQTPIATPPSQPPPPSPQKENNNNHRQHPVFASDPFPRVVFDKRDDKDENENDDDDDDPQTRSEDTIDAFSNTGFLKLIENHGTNTQPWPKLQARLRTKQLRVDLLLHQIHGLCWMYGMETSLEHGLNSLLWETRRFPEGDTYHYSPALGQIRLTLGGTATTATTTTPNDNTPMHYARGGILADEMGLGKTIQVLALVLATLDDLRDAANHMPKHYTPATLIIVPPALVGQWISEIQKVTGDALVVDFFDHKRATFCRQSLSSPSSSSSEKAADVVVTTYQALEKKSKRNRNTTSSGAAADPLTDKVWGRIVLDEMQEVRSWTTGISKQCQKLQSNRRWMLSGTPLLEGIQDFKGELCFLGVEPFAANNEDGFFEFAVNSHWQARSRYGLDILRVLSLFMLRRSKSMYTIKDNKPLLPLKPLTITFEPVPQATSERALYCFLEFLMHSILKKNTEVEEDNNNSNSIKKHQRNKLAFLRMLRDLCVTPSLVNGGVGCTSQLDTLNRWMKDYNRQLNENRWLNEPSSPSAVETISRNPVYSCDEAIRFLSQVEDVARTESDYVTDLRLGGGAGISRRDRAFLESPKEVCERAKARVKELKAMCEEARKKRAKARWLRALEGVTTGKLSTREYQDVTPCFRSLWKSRSSVRTSKDRQHVHSLLRRGWRPTARFFGVAESQLVDRVAALQGLHKRQPNFLWAHPFALLFSNIPAQVTKDDLYNTLSACLKENDGMVSSKSNIFAIGDRKSSGNWKAIVHLDGQDTLDFLIKKAKGVRGIKMFCREEIPSIEQEIELANVNLKEALAANSVHPCPMNAQMVASAKKRYKEAKTGLRICSKGLHQDRYAVLLVRAFGAIRSVSPQLSESFYQSTRLQVQEATETLKTSMITIVREEALVKRLETRLQGLAEQVSLNTFEALQALKAGEGHIENTVCPICYDHLGRSEGSNGKVYMTRCGHLSCFSCLDQWMNQKEQQREQLSCIECRKPVVRPQLVCVDPGKKDDERLERRQKEAKSMVRVAAEMLAKNNGKLEPHLWEALYLAMDLPTNADQSGHGIFTAIPGRLLAHLRNATGMSIHCTRKQSAGRLSSKVQALLADLPKDELSVVFASSKATIVHLLEVLKQENIGCRGLFTGQSEKDSERAVAAWKSDSDVLVLVVQAGVAACGLTLTAASKMFLMEPFIKHEEEKQAYARLHRYGQRRPVDCKVYFAPVSVESRLLEWRRLTMNHKAEEEKTVYAPLRDVCDLDDDLEEEDTDTEENQTRFLLALGTDNEIEN